MLGGYIYFLISPVHEKILRTAHALCGFGYKPEPNQTGFLISENQYIYVEKHQHPDAFGNYSINVELRMKKPGKETFELVFYIRITAIKEHRYLYYEVLMPLDNLKLKDALDVCKTMTAIKIFSNHIIFNLQE